MSIPAVSRDETVTLSDSRRGPRQVRRSHFAPEIRLKLWVEQGWLMARRSTGDDEVEWQVVLARASDARLPVIDRNAAAESLEIAYRNYFIREDGQGRLRILREPKGEHSPAWPALDFKPWEHQISNMSGGRMKMWQSDFWCWLSYGPTPEHPDIWVRLRTTNRDRKPGRSIGLTTMSHQAGTTEAWDDDYRILFEHDLCVARRMIWEHPASGTRLRERLGVDLAPALAVGEWINTERGPDLDELDGKVVLVAFWASWCEPSVRRLARLQELHTKYAARNLVVVGIHAAHQVDKAREIVQAHAVDFPVGIDAGEKVIGTYVPGETAQRYHVDALPAFFLVDQAGKVVKGYGQFPPTDSEIESLLP